MMILVIKNYWKGEAEKGMKVNAYFSTNSIIAT